MVRQLRLLWIICFTLFIGFKSIGSELQWGGLYRFEGLSLINPELTGQKSEKSYMVQHLVLNPKFVASDGMYVHSRFELMNNSTFGNNNQFGDFVGGGVGSATPTGSDSSNTLSKNQKFGSFQVSELYMNWNQEFGQLVVGRAPLNFGLGMWFNSGRGDYDHYLTTLDMVSYKIVTGNLFIMPMYGKVSEGNTSAEDDVNDYIVHVQYDNPETELSLGVLYQMRISTGNDIPTGTNYFGGTGSTLVGNYKHTYFGLFASQKSGAFRYGLEAGILSGESGVQTSVANGSSSVRLNGLGLSSQVDWMPTNSKWSGQFKFGFASGDDPGSNDSQEGFIFNRNYRLGMLLFRHPMGQRDFLRTGLVRDATAAYSARNTVDTEALSNSIFFAPSFTYKANDRWSYTGLLVTGRLNNEPIVSGNTAKDLGYEMDLSVTYEPFDRLNWTTEAAVLLPGEAWKAGSSGLENAMAYGFMTKAAVRF